MSNSQATILENFDKEVECRCKFIRSHSENLSINMLSALDLALMGIPENVRKMPIKTLMEKYNGDIIKASESFEIKEKQEETVQKKKKAIPSPHTPTTMTGLAKRTTPTSTTRLNRSAAKK